MGVIFKISLLDKYTITVYQFTSFRCLSVSNAQAMNKRKQVLNKYTKRKPPENGRLLPKLTAYEKLAEHHPQRRFEPHVTKAQAGKNHKVLK